MKNIFFLLLIFVSFVGFSQKKKGADPKDLKIDSLTTANAALATQLDSLSKDRELYYGVYVAIKDKVILHEFDPAQMPAMIDSLRTNRDATISGLTEASTSLSDSLSALSKENVELKAQLKEFTTSSDKTSLITELKQLKELLDSKIITQAEYDEKKKLVMDKWQ